MENKRIKYDVIIPVAKKDVSFVHWVIDYVRENFVDAQTIFIIANADLFSKLQKVTGNANCMLIDENKMLDGLTYSSVKNCVISKKQRPNITGHYFQQFLKMGFAITGYCNDYYLSWDSDTIPLSKIDFFKDGHPLFVKKKEYRERYFEVMKQVLGIGRQIDGSFIAEHMMFKSSIMREMIDRMNERANGVSWWEALINCTDENIIDENIMSEFEMYGSYCMAYYPGVYEFHDLKAFRHAGIIRGRKINKRILRMLAYDIDMASFEIYNSPYSLFKYKNAFRKCLLLFSTHKIMEWPKILKMIVSGESLNNF